ncbi:ABC transporter ATP-binding protein [Amycolatopsis roodepoortensis]|uniref:Simple sugar transport system ATP-binding protein n=1 Tax=Amycolatopsis roodepoortensis TaxID=700274 RepID=A0ABR9LDA1_9PSEU|nr:ABC transporter ATP-binding protein [Amycolatopsis roodepoortensis]MBE1578307.1 simple sugar transport system ATP-binding protein [Amycolatopsis roodepoortensis]
MTPPNPDAVSLRGIVKRFPGVLANDHVDLDVGRGEIHALMGENGAGKSTLMSVLYGLHRPDEGTISLHGEEVSFGSPAQAIDAGVGMVQQGFALFGELTVTENVVFGSEPTRRGLLDRKAATARVTELIERHELRLRPGDRVRDLPVGLRQRVEILKLLYREAGVLILDEPTAVLTPPETERLFGVLRALASEDRTILLVSHKLQEVLAVSDQVTVLRDGRVSARGRTADQTAAGLAAAMTGREVDLDRAHPAGTPGDTVLEARSLTVPGAEGKPLLDNVSLTVRAGEIVGVAGVAGNGQAELSGAVTGLLKTDGSIVLKGQNLDGLSVRARRDAGLAHVPEDRSEVGSAPTAGLRENLAVGFHRKRPLVRKGFLRRKAIDEHASAIIDDYDVRASGPTAAMGTLSGGNQQKAIFGRELTHDAPFLLVEQPTRGVDVGAIENIHARLVAHRDAGHAVLLISAELSEILALSDRVLVLFEGRIVAEFTKDEADQHTIGLAMAGGAG